MNLTPAACSDVGRRRETNEDRYAVEPELGLYLVSDGMGGHVAGQIASELATEAAVRAIKSLEHVPATLTERLRYAVARANQEVHLEAREKPELAGMGTTLVALLAREGRVALAHVGDSRAYLVREGQIRQLTEDHSLVGELLRRREITEKVARKHPQRHVLTRALGVREVVEPDLAEMSSSSGDVFVLCSDGLTNHVRDAEIAEMIAEETDLESACKRLVDLANDRGGEDNTTLVLVRIDDLD
jgi:protein phosphatase